MRACGGLALGLAVPAVLAVALLQVSCEKAERMTFPPEAGLTAPSLSGDQGSGDSLQFGLIEIGIVELDSLLVGEIQVLEIPGPEEIVDWLVAAYAERDASVIAMLLADDFVCTEITRFGIRSWGRETEILIHERMFDPECAVKPIADIQLTLENRTVMPLEPSGGSRVYVVTCDAHLVLDYAGPEGGAFEFAGPAEFHVRRNLDLPSFWELSAWHDRLPDGGS